MALENDPVVRKAIKQYAATRPKKPFRTACYAPFVALQFYANGMVQVCCENVHYLVGDARRQTIAEIWNGPKIQALRSALREFDFGRGFEFCKWEIVKGNHETRTRAFMTGTKFPHLMSPYPVSLISF